MSYIIIPKELKLKYILRNHCSFSPHSLKGVFITNKNTKTLGEIIGEKFFKGKPVSRSSFVENSQKYLITNSALQNDFLLSRKRGSSFIPLNPSAFHNPIVIKNSILLALNGNVGQSSFVDIEDTENYTISPWMINFHLPEKQKYIFAFLKSKFFLEQVSFLTPKGAILSNANKKILEAQIVFPNGKNSDNTIEYIEILVQSILNKEKEIQNKNLSIFNLITKEIFENQGKKEFHYSTPKVSQLLSLNRINASFYSKEFKQKEFNILNYSNGTISIKDLGFKITRGQNLQVSCIGKSIYSDSKIEGFYTLVIPKNISVYGTVIKYEYLGSSKKLKTLKKGDIIFGAEGFEKGRSVVIFEDRNNTITNIHGMTINHHGNDIALSVFIKCYLDYLRQTGLIDLYAVGGNGGSLAQKYWDVIPFPNFPEKKQKEISKLYFNDVEKTKSNFKNYIDSDNLWNKEAGIVQLDESLKNTKEYLESVINEIVLDKEVKTNFDF